MGLVFEATNTKPVSLIGAAAPIHSRIIILQLPLPGTARVVRRRPKVTKVTHIDVATITAAAETRGKASKSTFIGCSRIWTVPMI